MACTVPVKGSSGKFGTDKCLEFIEENGDGEGEETEERTHHETIEPVRLCPVRVPVRYTCLRVLNLGRVVSSQHEQLAGVRCVHPVFRA